MAELVITTELQFKINEKCIEMENEINSYFDTNIKIIDEELKKVEEF